MKALAATTYGAPEQLQIIELDVPRPGPGQMQVKIAASSINPTDTRVTIGLLRAVGEVEFPYVLGNDFAGTVTEVGPGVTQYAVGDEVFGQALPRQLSFVASNQRPSLTTGGMAEYAVVEVDTSMLAHRPANVPAEQAAALGIVGLTALAVIDVAKIQPGERVLVVGATGGVGTAVLPLIKQATVIATAGREADAEMLRELGADEVIGYGEYPENIDVVLNLAVFSDELGVVAKALRPGGRLTSIVFPGPTPEQLGRDDVEVQVVMDLDGRHATMQDVARAASEGQLTARIARSYPLAEGVQAAVAYERDHLRGKVVVTM